MKKDYIIEQMAESRWFYTFTDKNKKGENAGGYNTTFLNIQQVTKQGDFAGSNRLKHMMDAMMHIDRYRDGLERSIHFSKNRDCDKDFKIHFAIHNDSVHYSYAEVNQD